MDISHQIDVKLLHFCTIFLITPSMLLSVAVCTNQIQQKFDRNCRSNSLEKNKNKKKFRTKLIVCNNAVTLLFRCWWS